MRSFVSAITPEIENELQSRRQSRGLQPVASELEGTPLGSLPDCVYGYTYSPVNDSTPLYAKRLFQCFEVHRLPGGVVHVLGFATPQEAQSLAARAALDFNLYPEPNGNSTTLVEISMERVLKAKPVSRSDGNYMPLSLDA
ncbi:MAG: hypothetical protein U0Q16_02920 [Bryobacteraceae bacterium]